MTFRTFYLFYALTILLLVFGLLTKDIEIIAASWHTTIIKGMWSFFIPTSIGAFLTGFIYHYWFNSGRPVRTRTIILHFSLVTVGILFSLNIYRLTTVLLSSGAPDTTAISGQFPVYFTWTNFNNCFTYSFYSRTCKNKADTDIKLCAAAKC